MNIRCTIYLFTAVAIVACSSNDDMRNEASTDERQVTKQQLVSETPITFAPVEIADVQWEMDEAQEGATRGGSVDADDFTVDSVGIFCLSRTKMSTGPKAVSWGFPAAYTDEQNLHNVWSNNEMAHIESVGANKGRIVWEKTNYLNYYPTKAWYTYGFVAYHPWTEYVDYSKSYVHAYIPVDGNDDVLYAMAKPTALYDDADVNNLAYSKQYYDAIKDKGLSDQGAYPMFQFRHIMSRLDFYFNFNETPSENIHVDKVEFDGFINIVRLILAKQSGGDMVEDLSKVYVTSAPSAKFPELTSFMGHFELRENGETPISGIKVDGEYKYNLTTVPQKVGDCILIPPVAKLPSANIKLYVTLCDDNGNKWKNASAITIPYPSPRWEIGKRYDVKITLNAPSVSAAPRRAASTFTASKVEVIPQ